MKTRNVVVFAASVGVAVMAAACSHDTDRGATTATTSAYVNADAVHEIAGARCDREERCDNVGPGKAHATRAQCVDEMRGKSEGELRGDKCGRVDRAQLDKCLADIRGERCDNVLDAIARVNSCRSGSLCTQ